MIDRSIELITLHLADICHYELFLLLSYSAWKTLSESIAANTRTKRKMKLVSPLTWQTPPYPWHASARLIAMTAMPIDPEKKQYLGRVVKSMESLKEIAVDLQMFNEQPEVSKPGERIESSCHPQPRALSVLALDLCA
jgi:hypothetical protein